MPADKRPAPEFGLPAQSVMSRTRRATIGTGKSLIVLALLAVAGGCEFLSKHVRVESDERSPFVQERTGGPASSGIDGIAFELHVPLTGDGKGGQETK